MKVVEELIGSRDLYIFRENVDIKVGDEGTLLLFKVYISRGEEGVYFIMKENKEDFHGERLMIFYK